MRKTPVKGTNDYLPDEAALRAHMSAAMLSVYENHGFERILTPAIEDIQNLDRSEGGDNLNLIFRILKRGDKLEKALENREFDQLADLGLRYDLTLPLCRYYAASKERLMLPFRCIQMGNVYRAERPQKGRLREFTQCDIDVLGSSSPGCEIELIDVTAKALLAVGLSDFTVRISDRRVLKALLSSMGFEPDRFDTAAITLDKLSHIGPDGVETELLEKGLPQQAVRQLLRFFTNPAQDLSQVLPMLPDAQAAQSLRAILDGASRLAQGRYRVALDLTLVRGQGYYTGTVFEIASSAFPSALGGGGRYDSLIGKFIGQPVPAVGFSIGFERIYSILSEQKGSIPGQKPKVAVLYEDVVVANSVAECLRGEYRVFQYEVPNKTGRFLARLEENGFKGYWICGQSQQLMLF